MEIKINTEISWKHDGEEIYLGNGSITLSELSIDVDVVVTSEVSRLISKTHPACIDIFQDFSDNIKYRKCHIGETPLNIDKTDTYVTHYRHSSDNSISWKLSSLKIEYKTAVQMNYSIICVPYGFLLLILKQCYSTVFPKKVDTMFCGKNYTLSDANDPNFAILMVPEDGDVEGFLLMMSLYTKSLVAQVMSFRSNGEKQIIECTPSLRNLDNEDPRNYELKFINFGKQHTLCCFLEQCTWTDKNNEERLLLSQAIYTYARSKYMDYNLQFLSIYSILERFSGKKLRDIPYDAMEEGLKRYNIDIQKIGKHDDPEIHTLRLILKRSNKDVNVINFCDLRDYIMHFMSNHKIDKTLAKSDLISNMRMAVMIILLTELGFNNISFIDGWEHLSVLLDNK